MQYGCTFWTQDAILAIDIFVMKGVAKGVNLISNGVSAFTANYAMSYGWEKNKSKIYGPQFEEVEVAMENVSINYFTDKNTPFSYPDLSVTVVEDVAILTKDANGNSYETLPFTVNYVGGKVIGWVSGAFPANGFTYAP